MSGINIKYPPARLSIDGCEFVYVKTRDYEPVSVYKSNNLFLRIGKENLVKKNLNLHKLFLYYGFCVPQIVSQGEINGLYYYTETNFGHLTLRDIFFGDYKKQGFISDKNFEPLLTLAGDFASIQLDTEKKDKNEGYEGFYSAIHVDCLIQELPHLEAKIKKAFDMIKERTSVLPMVLTHGDFTCHNIFKRGFIDFERALYAPAGYDVVTNIYDLYNLPRYGEYERTRKYEFSERQIKSYFLSIDLIYKKKNIFPVSRFINDFVMARIIFYIARMHNYPKLQRFGYCRFENILDSYLGGEDILRIIVE